MSGYHVISVMFLTAWGRVQIPSLRPPIHTDHRMWVAEMAQGATVDNTDHMHTNVPNCVLYMLDNWGDYPLLSLPWVSSTVGPQLTPVFVCYQGEG